METREMIERHLAQAETHVRQGESILARQEQIIAELERDGHADAALAARDSLATFELTQKSHVEDRDRLRAELAALNKETNHRPAGQSLGAEGEK